MTVRMLLVSTVALGVLLTNSLIDDYHPSRATSAAGVPAAAAAADGAAPRSFRDAASAVTTLQNEAVHCLYSIFGVKQM